MAAGRLVVAGKQQTRLDAMLTASLMEEKTFKITRPSGKPGVWLIRVPMPLDGNAPPDARYPAIALMIHDSGAIDKIDLEGFAKVHDLTPAEARIMNLLLEHTSLPPISRELGVSINTVSSQLKALREKTGTRRQA